MTLRGMSRSTARRIGDAPLIRTTLQSADATVLVDDHLADGAHGFASGTIVRLITVQSGSAEIEWSVVGGSRFAQPRRTYRGTDSVAWVSTDLGAAVIAMRGINGDAGSQPTVLQSGDSLMITISPDATDERVRREEYDRQMSTLQRTWRRNLDSGYDGPWRADMRTWFQQLLLLSNRDSGALVRSFTTSLPSSLGGERQIDERLAYLEDGARFVRLAERLDRGDSVGSTRTWVADALRRGDDRARRADGTNADAESDLMLPGWRGHQPVRRGNKGASTVDLAAIASASLVLDANHDRRTIVSVANRLTEQFRSPTRWDGGRWGAYTTATRGKQLQATQWISSVIAVRSALRAATVTERRHNPISIEAAEWQQLGRELDHWLHANGCFGTNATAGWRRSLDDNSSDAQLLRFIAPSDTSVDLPDLPDDREGEAAGRVSNAINQTLAQLDDHGLLHRHLPHADDGFAPGQGADVSATADTVSALCRLGRWDEANERMEFLQTCLTAGSDGVTAGGERDGSGGRSSGIVTVPSHVDPRTHQHLGNRPYAPALLSLCEAAMALQFGPL